MGYTIQAILGIIVFVVILFTIGYLCKRMVASGRYTLRKSKHLQSLDRLYLSNDKWLEVVKTGDKIMILGVSQGGINVLEVIKQEDLDDIQTEEEKNYFSSILEKYIKNKIKKTNE